MMRISMALLFLSAAAQAQEPPSGAPAAKDVLARIQKYYDNTRDLHARFEQTLESGIGGRPRKASGQVWLKKPGKMRWDYEKPEDDKKLMVADGQTLWVYEAEDQQAYKQELKASTLPTQVSFLVGEGKLQNEFDASIVPAPPGVGQPGDVVVKLVPKTGTAQYRYLLFDTDPRTGAVKETVIYDQQGGTNKLVFSNVEQNKGVDDARFKFSPPPGTKILAPPR